MQGLRALITVLLSFAVAMALATPAQAATVTVTNGTQLGGVHAHGGGVLKVGNYYYWYGENRDAKDGFKEVSIYRSTDLRNWQYRGAALTSRSHPELSPSWVERPKVIYNSSTRKYVLWAHWENGIDYGQARAMVATSDSPDGPFTYDGSFRPMGNMSRDATLYKDRDGRAYFITASNENADLHVYRLTDDYRRPAQLAAVLWAGEHREAPAIFERNGVFFLVTSGQTGWAPNQQMYATATSITGPWSALQNLGDSSGFGAQTTFVLPISGSTTSSYLWMGDDWATADSRTVNDSTYRWLPLEFTGDRTMRMNDAAQISVDTSAGTLAASPSGGATYLRARHSSKCLTVNSDRKDDGALIDQWTCGSGPGQQWTLQNLDGYVRIVNRHSSKCLTVKGDHTNDGAKVDQWTCSSGLGQQWTLQNAGNGYVRLLARHSGKCLTVANDASSDGAVIDQYSCGSGANQQWRRS